MVLKRKGQMSIFGLIVVVFEFIIFAALLPAIIETISQVQGISGIDPITSLLVALFPSMFVLSILLTLLVFAGGRQ